MEEERRQIGKKVTISIYRKLKALAIEQGREVGKLLDEAIQDYLVKQHFAGRQTPNTSVTPIEQTAQSTVPNAAVAVSDETTPGTLMTKIPADFRFSTPDLTRIITIISPEGLARKKGDSAAQAKVYRNGMTIAEYFDACRKLQAKGKLAARFGKSGDIRWDVDHRYIGLGPIRRQS